MMLEILVTAAALTATNPDLLDAAIQRWQALQSYRTTLHSTHQDGEEHLRYYYRKPGDVRMEFIKPHAGAVLVYSSATSRVKLWPFGAGRFPELNLSPDNRLIRSPRGQQVDRSDVGALLDNITHLREQGTLRESEERLDGAATRKVDVLGNAGIVVGGVHRYELWLDPETLFPLKVISHTAQGNVLETVRFEETAVNIPMPDTFF